MAVVRTTHFKVDNGDMALVEIESGRRILVDIRIRASADDEANDTPDVGTQLRDRLEEIGRDGSGRLYVDAFLLTHPDQDHISGLANHFHLGLASSWSKTDDKIFIREMWSSPIVFRRASKAHNLCADADAWATEARRRVALFRSQRYALDGDQIKILGEDVDGKTDDLGPILVRAGETITVIAGNFDASFSGLLLAPLLATDDEEDKVLSKNNSSVIMRMTLAADGVTDAARYLFGGDAEVAIWEKVRDKYDDDDLNYHVLIAPHHCSWHSLSWDSWGDMGEKAKVSDDARSALAQAQPGATILASSCTVEDNEDDPPCIRAEREYKTILKPGRGVFTCLADQAGDDPYEMVVNRYGPKASRRRVASAAYATGVGSEPLGHG
jgi:hypothetical protein